MKTDRLPEEAAVDEDGPSEADLAFEAQLEKLAAQPDDGADDEEKQPESKPDADAEQDGEEKSDDADAEAKEGEEQQPAEGEDPAAAAADAEPEATVDATPAPELAQEAGFEEYARTIAAIDAGLKSELEKALTPLVKPIQEIEAAEKALYDGLLVEDVDEDGRTVRRERAPLMSELKQYEELQAKRRAIAAKAVTIRQQLEQTADSIKFDRWLGVVGKMCPALKGYESEIVEIAQLPNGMPKTRTGDVDTEALLLRCRLERERRTGKKAPPPVKAADVAKAAEQRVRTEQQKKALGKITAGKPGASTVPDAAAAAAKAKQPALARAKRDLDAHEYRALKNLREELGMSE